MNTRSCASASCPQAPRTGSLLSRGPKAGCRLSRHFWWLQPVWHLHVLRPGVARLGQAVAAGGRGAVGRDKEKRSAIDAVALARKRRWGTRKSVAVRVGGWGGGTWGAIEGVAGFSFDRAGLRAGCSVRQVMHGACRCGVVQVQTAHFRAGPATGLAGECGRGPDHAGVRGYT